LIDAFNARDLDGMLDCLAADVDFHPLRLGGPSGSYRGHGGVTEWFAQLRDRDQRQGISLSEARCVGDGQVLAIGSLTLGGETDLGPFWGLHRLADGLFVAVHHYLSDPEMIEQLGLIRRAGSGAGPAVRPSAGCLPLGRGSLGNDQVPGSWADYG
jgi:hypothetical protein